MYLEHDKDLHNRLNRAHKKAYNRWLSHLEGVADAISSAPPDDRAKLNTILLAEANDLEAEFYRVSAENDAAVLNYCPACADLKARLANS
jgi:hypothetical protein